MDKEEWKNIEGSQGVYQVSNLGRVRSLKQGKIHVLRQYLNPDGYYQVWVNGSITGVHRLVAKAFAPNPENKSEVDHIDANRSNNISSNLRWVTHKENCNHPHFIEAQNNRLMKEINSKNRAIIKMDLDGNDLEEIFSLTEAKRKYGYDPPSIRRSILNNKKMYGFKWKYKKE